jgi:hypothetical protein
MNVYSYLSNALVVFFDALFQLLIITVSHQVCRFDDSVIHIKGLITANGPISLSIFRL